MLTRQKDLDFITLTYLDNEALDKITVDEIESHRNNKAWWQVYGLGQLGVLEGRIYTNWQIVKDIPHEARLERFGIDFGYTNDPTVIVAIYRYNDGFILDEVTYQKDFELQLKNIYDQQNAKVYVSSSSASILRSKKAFLTGRNVVLEILPLDFEEYLGFKEIVVKKSDRHLLEKYFEDFMQTGGMPEYVLTGDIEYLKELVDDVIQKDIAAFYGVKDVQVLKDFFLLLMERSGKVFSINKIAKILDISPDSAKRYLQMFADSFLIFLVSRFGKTNERLLSAKKIYAADLGMRVYFTGFRDKGSLFENYVYLKIKKFNPSYVYQDGNEIDFLTEGKTLIEVKYNAQMGVDQKELFDKIKVREKILIENIFDLEKISNLEK